MLEIYSTRAEIRKCKLTDLPRKKNFSTISSSKCIPIDCAKCLPKNGAHRTRSHTLRGHSQVVSNKCRHPHCELALQRQIPPRAVQQCTQKSQGSYVQVQNADSKPSGTKNTLRRARVSVKAGQTREVPLSARSSSSGIREPRCSSSIAHDTTKAASERSLSRYHRSREAVRRAPHRQVRNCSSFPNLPSAVSIQQDQNKGKRRVASHVLAIHGRYGPMWPVVDNTQSRKNKTLQGNTHGGTAARIGVQYGIHGSH